MDLNVFNLWMMHLSSEVSSTTNGLGHEAPSSSYGNALQSQPLTAELLAERTLEGLLADHPGELVKTGSPHVVRFSQKYSSYTYIIISLSFNNKVLIFLTYNRSKVYKKNVNNLITSLLLELM